ncbi:MAG: FAD-dependent oxidoreductase, partial [Pseudomonadota bacterium]
AGIMNGLGVDTTLIYRKSEILRGFDDEVRGFVRAEMEKKGVKFIFNQVLTRLEKTPTGLSAHLTGGGSVEIDQALFAIGRKPNTAGLGLENADLEVPAGGAIPVDAWSQTTTPSVFAVGDVTDRINLTPVAIREGHAFADTVFGGAPRQADHALVATAVFTQPEIGTVGLSEEEARAEGGDVDIYKSAFRPMLHTLSGRDEKMFMKIIVRRSDDRVLGVHLVGHGAGEMIQCLGVAVKMGASKADFDATMAVHPTAAEELVTMRAPSG